MTYDDLVEWEGVLLRRLRYGKLDGHDVGGGIFNIFIKTDAPEECFKEVMRFEANERRTPVAAGFREIRAEHYVRLWPDGDQSPFELR